MKRWRIAPVEEATEQVAFLLQDEGVGETVKYVLKLLSQQADPRHPSYSANLDVTELDHFPNWFRLKITRPMQVRFVFRIQLVQGELLVRLERDKPVPEDVEEGFIEITRAGFRTDQFYGDELKRLYCQYEDDE